MKLRTQIVALGLAGALFAGGVGGIATLAASRLSESLDAAIAAGSALRASQDADMMHDAVRSDVLMAMLGAHEGDAARVAEARKDLQEHAANFRKALDEIQGLRLPEPTVAVVAQTLPKVRTYIDAAEQAARVAAEDLVAAEKGLPGFQQQFEVLETQMAEMSGAIETTAQTIDEAAKASVTRTTAVIAVACAIATLAMAGLALGLARRMIEPVDHAVEVADRLAQGDLTVVIRPHGNHEAMRLLEAMSRMRHSFADIVTQVKRNAEGLAAASAQIAHGNEDLSGRTEQQAGALQQTAATMEQLGATVRTNADNARQADQLAQGASSIAVKGGEVVGQVVQTMRGIDESARRIADIIAVIDGIAFQTNILALNAAVEAARVGEQGRGFAVVAGEVRSLAGRSAEAAREIKGLIAASVERVHEGSLLVDAAGRTMGEIVGSIRRVTDIVGEISSASVEQSAGVGQVGRSVAEMDRATQRNTSLVEESAAAARSVREQADRLVRLVAVFKLGASGDACAAG